ncbi:MAG: hypothetical protein ACPGTO_10305 [Polaribacter sp.]
MSIEDFNKFLKSHTNFLNGFGKENSVDYYSPLCLKEKEHNIYYKCISDTKTISLCTSAGNLSISTFTCTAHFLEQYEDGTLDKISIEEFDSKLRDTTYKLLDYANY